MDGKDRENRQSGRKKRTMQFIEYGIEKDIDLVYHFTERAIRA